MTDKFAPGFDFGLPDPRRGASKAPAISGPAPGSEFGLKPPAAPLPLPPAREPDFVGRGFFLERGPTTPGGATSLRYRRGVMPTTGPVEPTPSDLRALLEGGLGAGAEFAGARLGPLGAAAGGAAGGFAGSLLSEVFDPTESPLRSASEAAAIEGASSAVASGVVAGLRRLIGKPDEAARWLITQAEKDGRLPTAGASLPDSALIQNVQAVGQADLALGHRVAESLEQSKLGMTDELRQYLYSYLRVKGEAKRSFKRYDTLVKNTLGSEGVVSVPDDMLRAAQPLVAGWKRLALDSKLDIRLIDKVEEGLRRLDSDTPIKFETPKLSLQEIQALEDRLRAAAIEMRRGRVGEKQELGGMQFARAYEQFGRDALKLWDDAVEQGIKDNRLPLEARVSLQGGRKLWRQWKSGELMLDKLETTLELAGHKQGPLQSSDVFTALGQIADDVKGGLVSKQQRDYLSGIARAIRLAEREGASKAFTWVVRAGQLGIVMNQASVLGSGEEATGFLPSGNSAFIVVAPATLAWLTTDRRAVGWLLRGMQVKPSTEAAVRLGRQLLTAMAREGVFPPERTTRTPGDDIPTPTNPEFLRSGPQRSPAFPSINPSFPTGPARPLRAPPLPAAPRG